MNGYYAFHFIFLYILIVLYLSVLSCCSQPSIFVYPYLCIYHSWSVSLKMPILFCQYLSILACSQFIQCVDISSSTCLYLFPCSCIMSHLSKPIFYLTHCMIALAMVCLPPFCIALFTIISRGSLFFLADTRFHVYPINKSEHILPLSYTSLQPFLILFHLFYSFFFFFISPLLQIPLHFLYYN